uniref:Uncharacterized protein n=2 Tax=Candidatus Bipolaricaulota TaxID=67810 RepID=H5SEX1_9BACT|nr:hypothetical protein HGMM_F17E10C37 [uncultured Acetothermia bacterium]BAL58308.1 hypothetical protein HGMM_OP1C003 [Candidatus Acetothermum autotrophicum]
MCCARSLDRLKRRGLTSIRHIDSGQGRHGERDSYQQSLRDQLWHHLLGPIYSKYHSNFDCDA